MLTIAHVDAERGFSGGEVQVFLLMEGLGDLGHRSVLFAPPGSRAIEEARARGIDTAEVSMRSDLALGAVGRLGGGFSLHGVDLVHLHTGRAAWLGGLAAWRRGLPAIVTRRMDAPLRRGLKTRLVYGTFTRRVVAISAHVADELRAGGVDPEKVRTIHSSVQVRDVEPGVRAATRGELGLADDAPVLLTLVSLVRRKGVDVLLDAFADVVREVPGAVLLVAGDGPERGELERRAARLGLAESVRFLGRRDDALALLAACDLFVLASRREGLGVAALEAMAAARPVVATRVGGLGQAVVDGATGRLVEPDDAPGLASAIARVLGDRSSWSRLGEAGRERVRADYSAEGMVTAYDALYREVLG